MPGELLVRFDRGVSPAERAAVRAKRGARLAHRLPLPGLELVRVARGARVWSEAARFERDPRVLYAEPNFYYRLDAVPNDTHLGQLWGLHNVGQPVVGSVGTPDADIDAPEVWDATVGSPSVIVAVVDSGIAYDHPDLAPNIWTNQGESGGGRESNGVDDDGNGRVDDWRGWDFVSDDNAAHDIIGHGSHVAGTVGARGNNALGVSGVNWQVALMPLRVCGAEGAGCSSAAIVSAFAYAGAMGAKVVNASFGGPDFSQAQLDAIDGAPGTLFVAAAGNEASNNDLIPQYPCNNSAPNVVCVAATDQSDALASFSNVGATSVDLAAPGVSILSTVPVYGAPILDEGFESDITSTWTTGGTNDSWARTDARASSGTFSLADSPGGNYLDNTNSFARTTGALSLSGKSGCRLEYRLRLSTEPEVDVLSVEASTDATNWTAIDELHGSSDGAFVPLTSDLSGFDGEGSVYLRFRLETNSSVSMDGAHVDGVRVGCHTTLAGDDLEFLSGTSMAAPHVAGAAALAWADSPGATVAEVRSRLLAGVDPKPSLAATVTGGRLNAVRALSQLPPTLTGSEPASPANDNAPRIRGTAQPGATVRLYASPDCTGPVAAEGSAAQLASPGLQASVPDDSSTTFRATATLGSKTSSCSSSSVAYVEDSTAPAQPVLTDTDPDSPANDNSPRIKGSAEVGSTVKLYAGADCGGPVAAVGMAGDLASPGLQVFVPDDSATTFRATATDPVGNTSGCSSSSIAYVERSTPPDGTPPEVKLGGSRVQELAKTIVVLVSAISEDMRATVSAKVAVAGTSKVYRAKTIKNAFVARGTQRRLRLKLPAKARKALRRALQNGRRIRAKLTLTARDGAANVTTRSRTVRFRR